MNDAVNGIFESFGGILCWFNVFKLFKDKEIKGISIWVSIFFCIWGFWNLYYYPSLQQWWSFWGGILLVSGNSFWVILAIFFTYRNEYTRNTT